MAKRGFKDKLIARDAIDEELRLIEGSDVDYITKTGKVYCDYGDDMFLKKSCFPNNHNGYIYVSLHMSNGKQIQRRVHRLVAEAFIEKPNENCDVVMHIDNNKANNDVSNLKWGTVSDNTRQAYNDGLAENDKGFDNSQSMPIAVFTLDGALKNVYGSVSIASKQEGVSKTGILFQAKHLVKNPTKYNKSRRYFRFLNEYIEKGFIL